MYRDFFGMRRRPFSITPDPQFLYLSGGHQEALAHLLYAIVDGGGFVLLTGEIGTGKTSVCRYALDQMPENVDVALIVNPELTKFELLATLCDEFGVAYSRQSDSHKELLDKLNRYLIDANARGRHSIVMIDEAQNLPPDVLEQLRLLTNLETDQRKLLQIILIGQPELNEILRRHNLRQLDQRIASRYHLRPLTKRETHAYIVHRLAVAGVTRPIFTPGSVSALHRRCRGFPRLINILCDRALLGAYADGSAMVTDAIVEAAAAEAMPKSTRFAAGLGKSTGAAIDHQRSGWRAMAAVSAMALGALLFVGSFIMVLSSPTELLPRVAMAPAVAPASAESDTASGSAGLPGDLPTRAPSLAPAVSLGVEHLEADIGDVQVDGAMLRRPASDCADSGASHAQMGAPSAATPGVEGEDGDIRAGLASSALTCGNLSLAVLPVR